MGTGVVGTVVVGTVVVGTVGGRVGVQPPSWLWMTRSLVRMFPPMARPRSKGPVVSR